ncbi:HAD family phosphatase [Streptomyces sp. SID13588]|nr:HAD family phosphatase [Streptomyces sp. SID13588]
MTLPAVIFDLDGTLVDSEPNYYEAGRRLLAAHGVRTSAGSSTRTTSASVRRRRWRR